MDDSENTKRYLSDPFKKKTSEFFPRPESYCVAVLTIGDSTGAILWRVSFGKSRARGQSLGLVP